MGERGFTLRSIGKCFGVFVTLLANPYLWADDFLRSGSSSSSKSCANFLSKPQSLMMEKLGVVVLPDVTEISGVAVHMAESLRIQTYISESSDSEVHGVKPLVLRELFKSLRVSNRKLLEFKNSVLERDYLSDSDLVESDFQLIQEDLEYWLEHLSRKYLSDLLVSLDYVLQGEGRQFSLNRTLMDAPVLLQVPWASRGWVKYAFQDEIHSLYGQFWMVEDELPDTVGSLGFFYLQELQRLLQQVQLAIDGHLQILPLLANYGQHLSGAHGQERARQSEELFVTAGLVHERMNQILDRILGSGEMN